MGANKQTDLSDIDRKSRSVEFQIMVCNDTSLGPYPNRPYCNYTAMNNRDIMDRFEVDVWIQ
jgi:hypothetical protein